MLVLDLDPHAAGEQVVHEAVLEEAKLRRVRCVSTRPRSFSVSIAATIRLLLSPVAARADFRRITSQIRSSPCFRTYMTPLPAIWRRERPAREQAQERRDAFAYRREAASSNLETCTERRHLGTALRVQAPSRVFDRLISKSPSRSRAAASPGSSLGAAFNCRARIRTAPDTPSQASRCQSTRQPLGTVTVLRTLASITSVRNVPLLGKQTRAVSSRTRLGWRRGLSVRPGRRYRGSIDRAAAPASSAPASR